MFISFFWSPFREEFKPGYFWNCSWGRARGRVSCGCAVVDEAGQTTEAAVAVAMQHAVEGVHLVLIEDHQQFAKM